MAAPNHDIEEKVEEAIKAYLDDDATLTGVTKYLGFDTGDIAAPSLEIFCPDAEPEVLGETATGNYFVTVEVTLRTSLDDTTRTAHGHFVAELRDSLIATVGDVVTSIQALGTKPADFTAHQWTPGGASREIDEEKRQRLTIQTGILFCQPS